MAGDWIKVEHVTPDKPEVVNMADMLGIDQDAVTGKLLRLWIWADQNSLDGCALSVTKAFINRIVFCNGFATALEKVGWLNTEEGILHLPNFTRHNGVTAKKRSDSNRRMTKSRDKKKNGCANVALGVQQKAQPEKRREEKSKKEAIASCPKTDDKLPILAELWKRSPAKSRERSSKVKVFNAWQKIKKSEQPDEGDLFIAIDAWSDSEKWTTGFAEGLHIWINDRQWENLPEASGKPKLNHGRVGTKEKIDLF
jgi:hypothetical protein